MFPDFRRFSAEFRGWKQTSLWEELTGPKVTQPLLCKQRQKQEAAEGLKTVGEPPKSPFSPTKGAVRTGA